MCNLNASSSIKKQPIVIFYAGIYTSVAVEDWSKQIWWPNALMNSCMSLWVQTWTVQCYYFLKIYTSVQKSNIVRATSHIPDLYCAGFQHSRPKIKLLNIKVLVNSSAIIMPNHTLLGLKHFFWTVIAFLILKRWYWYDIKIKIHQHLKL